LSSYQNVGIKTYESNLTLVQSQNKKNIINSS